MVDLYIHCIFTECLLSEYILLYFNASHDQAVCLYNALQRLHVSAELHWQFCWRDCHRGMRSANSRVKQRLKMDCCFLELPVGYRLTTGSYWNKYVLYTQKVTIQNFHFEQGTLGAVHLNVQN